MNAAARAVRDFTARLDRGFGTGVKPALGRSYRRLMKGLSAARRVLDPLIIRMRYRLRREATEPLRLHLGCGDKRFEGYTNVDFCITDATDAICNIEKLPWPDRSAQIVECHHVLEHISHRKVEAVLREWHRVLQPGGLLVIECPDFDRTVKEYLDGNDDRLFSIFGIQHKEGHFHLSGQSPARLARLLETIGFSPVVQAEPRSVQAEEEPVFRLEATKPIS